MYLLQFAMQHLNTSLCVGYIRKLFYFKYGRPKLHMSKMNRLNFGGIFWIFLTFITVGLKMAILI